MSTVIDRVLAALNARDLEALVACYDLEAMIEDGDDRVLAHGHPAIRNRYGPMEGWFIRCARRTSDWKNNRVRAPHRRLSVG